MKKNFYDNGTFYGTSKEKGIAGAIGGQTFNILTNEKNERFFYGHKHSMEISQRFPIEKVLVKNERSGLRTSFARGGNFERDFGLCMKFSLKCPKETEKDEIEKIKRQKFQLAQMANWTNFEKFQEDKKELGAASLKKAEKFDSFSASTRSSSGASAARRHVFHADFSVTRLGDHFGGHDKRTREIFPYKRRPLKFGASGVNYKILTGEI